MQHGDRHKNEHWRWVGPSLRRLQIRNYRNIGRCDVSLAPLSVVVGRNGAGKSNLLDGIGFVADAVRGSLERAIGARGGLEAVRRRSTGHPRTVRSGLELRLPSWHLARYGFQLVSQPGGSWSVVAEHASVRDDGNAVLGHYQRSDGTVFRTSLKAVPPADGHHLYLPRAADHPPFRELYDTLASMVVYRFDRAALHGLPVPGDGERLAPDGSNLPSVLARLANADEQAARHVASSLAAIEPGTLGVERVAAGPRETVQFRRKIAGSRHPWKLHATDMADGVLYALATLVAAFQDQRRDGIVSLVGLESPEHGLHPTAMAPLVDALAEAAQNTQIVLTTHSPDLLDALHPERDRLLAVRASGGTATIATADAEGGPEAGERLRQDALRPARPNVPTLDQLGLFGPPEQD